MFPSKVKAFMKFLSSSLQKEMSPSSLRVDFTLFEAETPGLVEAEEAGRMGSGRTGWRILS
jgi:hypothetical protein